MTDADHLDHDLAVLDLTREEIDRVLLQVRAGPRGGGIGRDGIAAPDAAPDAPLTRTPS